MNIEMKAIDELIYEVEMFEQAGVYPVQNFIDTLKTLAVKVKAETKLEGCVVVPVEPTEEMVHAFEKGMLESEHFFGEFEAFNDGYKAMVEAARGVK